MLSGNEVREGELDLDDNVPSGAKNKQKEEQEGPTGQDKNQGANRASHLGVQNDPSDLSGPPTKRNRGEEGEQTQTGNETNEANRPTQFAATKAEVEKTPAEDATKTGGKLKSGDVVTDPLNQAWQETADQYETENAQDHRVRKTRDYLEEEHDEAARDMFSEGKRTRAENNHRAPLWADAMYEVRKEYKPMRPTCESRERVRNTNASNF